MYYVDVSGEISSQIKRLFKRALSDGRGEAFIASLKEIQRRLASDPLHFGEPLYQLRLLQLSIRKAAIVPIYVEYSVSAEHRIVVIRRCVLMDLHR